MNDNYIAVRAVSKKYKNQYALKDCNVTIKKDRIYGVVGPNGAGKTTLFRLMLGLSEPTEGEITYKNGQNLKEAGISFGTIIEKPYINPNMTAVQNLKYMEILYGHRVEKENIDKILKMVGLGNEGNKKVKKFSLGMKQRLGIAMVVINRPDILILDEPMNGLDPEGMIEIRKIILDIYRERKCTMVISSHILSELDKLATDYIFIKEGRILLTEERTILEERMVERGYSEIEELYMDIVR